MSLVEPWTRDDNVKVIINNRQGSQQRERTIPYRHQTSGTNLFENRPSYYNNRNDHRYNNRQGNIY